MVCFCMENRLGTVSITIKIWKYRKTSNTFFLCSIAIIITEPVGAKAPTFPTDSKISMFVRNVGDDFALLCQAQGSPIPSIRLVQYKKFQTSVFSAISNLPLNNES